MTTRTSRVQLVAAVSVVACALAIGARAQDDDPFSMALAMAPEGGEAEPDELEAYRLVTTERRYVRARELAERVVEERPDSYVGHFVLGLVQHYGESSFPRALYHENLALALFERAHGERPVTPAPWRWHSRLLRELAMTHGDLEHHADKVAYLERYNELYEPDMIAEQAWPLMKMGRFDDARRAAERALAEGSAFQTELALNALCAVEFEAGNDGASYEACRAALDWGRSQPGGANAVDFTNFAEASRSLFKLDEAERVGLEATTAPVAWYGNPWVELGELYVREARFPEALSALRRAPEYRSKRPAHVRDSDRNEGRRALAAFFLTVGRPDEALDITDKALVAPDRRAHNSRDPNQDSAIIALLDRRARLMRAEQLDEAAAAGSFWERVTGFAEATALRFEAWMRARQAARLLADDTRLVGTFRIGTSTSAVTPPWLAGELVEVMGAGVVGEAVRRARARDRRPGASAYYDAFEAEAALEAGDPERAVELAERARRALNPAEAMLRARVDALSAEAERQRGRSSEMWERAFLADPGVFRRLELAVPARLEGGSGAIGEAVRDALADSPRLDLEDHGLVVRVAADATGGRICLVGRTGGILGCGEAEAMADESPDALVASLVAAFHRDAFAPRIDLTQADASSLDGTNESSRDALDDMLDRTGPLDP